MTATYNTYPEPFNEPKNRHILHKDFWKCEQEAYHALDYGEKQFANESELVNYIDEVPLRILYREETETLCLVAIKKEPIILRMISQTVKICLEAIKISPDNYRFVEPFIRNQIVCIIFSNISIALKSLRLPSYVLADIIDTVLMQHTLTHYIKIHKIIHLNEQLNF